VVEIKDLPGTYEIDIRSRILRRILLEKEYEPEIVALIKQQVEAGRDAINVGANVGIFAVLLARLIKDNRKVLAVEPTPLAFGHLVNNFKRNDLSDKAIFYNGVCGDSAGQYQLNTIVGKEEFSSIGDSYMNNAYGNVIQIQVEGETVDSLVTKSGLDPGLMLVDVEGAEMKVLKGAASVLKNNKPIVISELVNDFLVGQGSSSEEVVRFLEDLGYEVKSTDDDGAIRHPFTGNIIAKPNR